MRWAPLGTKAGNPVFDVTPAELVSGLMTERSAVFTPDRGKIALLFRG